MIHVYITDDQEVVVESLQHSINCSGFAQVTACFNDLKSCREGLANALPDVLILDVGLPDGNGDDFCAEITALYPQLKVLMFSSYDSINIALRSFDNGATGYIVKDASIDEILNGIQSVAKGEKFLSKNLDLLMRRFLEKKEQPDVFVSKREKDVLNGFSKGLSASDIALILSLSEETVIRCSRDLMLKFEVSNTDELLLKTNSLNI
jgi:DNA-binding NarL/FixJ family response regulator